MNAIRQSAMGYTSLRSQNGSVVDDIVERELRRPISVAYEAGQGMGDRNPSGQPDYISATQSASVRGLGLEGNIINGLQQKALHDIQKLYSAGLDKGRSNGQASSAYTMSPISGR